MTPYYQDDFVTLWHGDCREILPRLSNVALVVTSPPYNKAGFEGFKRTAHKDDSWRGGRNIEYGEFDDFMPEPEYQAWQLDVLGDMHAAMLDGASLFYNHKVRVRDYHCSFPVEWLLRSPFKVRQEVVWDRGSTPSVAPIRFLAATERVYWLCKGEKPRHFSPQCATWGEVWRIPALPDPDHPAPFPLEIPQRCIQACSLPDDLVCDPFAGRGTTLRAAKNLGRRAVGIEMSERFCEVAAQRLSQSVLDFGGAA